MPRPVLSACLTTLLFTAGAIAAPTPAPTLTPALLETLDAADLERAIPLLKEHYVSPAALSATELDRATLAGLLDHLGRGVMLRPAHAPAAPAAAPFYREILDEHVGYLRPGELSRAQLQELDTSLRAFAGKKVNAIVLDLRASAETNDYATTAEFANRFVAKGKPLFSLHGPALKPDQTFSSNQHPAYSGFIALLVDGETAGASEVLAAVLRHYEKAIVVGQKTAGRAVDYTDLPLPSGNVLRVAVAEAVLPDQRPRFPDGVTPDLPVAMPIADKREIFQQSVTKGMASYVFEADRPHLNEAALLAGTNPEIEAAQAAQQRRARGGEKPALHDPVLQRAVDVVTSIAIYEQPPGRVP